MSNPLYGPRKPLELPLREAKKQQVVWNPKPPELTVRDIQGVEAAIFNAFWKKQIDAIYSQPRTITVRSEYPDTPEDATESIL